MARKVSKVSFTKRLAAYIIDLMIIYCVASMVSYPFMNQKTNEKLAKEITDISEKYENREISSSEYFANYSTISYKISRNTGIYSIITIILQILYFVVLQIRMGGQTFGKQIMHLKVVSDDGNLDVNQMIFRSFIANFILFNIISFVLMLFCPKSVYFYGIAIFDFIQYAICIVSILMILYGKKGVAIHDIIAHTKVISA